MSGSQRRTMPGLELVKADLAAMERLLNAETRSDVRLVIEVSRHILESGGKRFRPVLTLLSGRMLGLRRKRELIAYAAAVEFAHTSTLLHDDVIDEADLRRGRVSANRRFGNAPAVIVGDYLLSKSFILFFAGQNPGVIQLISRIAVLMAEGEAYQLAQKQRVDLTESDYERIVKSKTALLIQAACQVPAIAMAASRRQESALARFGYHLGLAFQMVDDVLDYSASDAAWGKQLGKDFLEAKTTLPLIIAYQNANPAERKLIRALFRKPVRTASDFEKLMIVIRRTHANEVALSRALDHVATAKRNLRAFPPSPARQALMGLADFVAQRTI